MCIIHYFCSRAAFLLQLLHMVKEFIAYYSIRYFEETIFKGELRLELGRLKRNSVELVENVANE